MTGSLFSRSASLILVAALFLSTDFATGQRANIAPISDADVEGLVDQLRLYPWKGPENFTSPIHWVFNFTGPMNRILQVGPAAQKILLHHLQDEGAKDQIVILLGGVGDVSSIEPIINAMAEKDEIKTNSDARRI